MSESQFPEKYFQNNYEKAKIFINECVKQDVKKIIFPPQQQFMEM